MKYISVIFKAAKVVFISKRYVISMMILAVIFFGVIILIPATIVPGNDVLIQLSIMPRSDILVIMIVSLLTAISLSFNLYLFMRGNSNTHSFGNAAMSGITGLTSSFFGSVTCVACAASVLGLVGVGTMTFIYQYRPILATISVGILLFSLYLTSKRILYLCDSCHVKVKTHE